MAPDRPSVLRWLSPSVHVGPGPGGPSRYSLRRFESRPVAGRHRWRSFPSCRSSPEVFGLLRTPRRALVRRSLDEPLRRTPDLSGARGSTRTERPTPECRASVGGCVPARSRLVRRFFRSRRSLREGRPPPSELGGGSSGDLAGASPTGCPGGVGRQHRCGSISRRSTFAPGILSDSVRSRGGSGCGSKLPGPIATGNCFPDRPVPSVRLRLASQASSELRSPGPSASLAGGRVFRSRLLPNDVSRAGSTSADELRLGEPPCGCSPSGVAEHSSVRWFFGPRRVHSNTRPVTVAPPPPERLLYSGSGRLQGLNPPTSPARVLGMLQPWMQLFLPWVSPPPWLRCGNRCRSSPGGASRASTGGLPARPSRHRSP